MLTTMIKDLHNINKSPFSGNETYTELARGVDSFLYSIHQTVKSKFPGAFNITEEEYEEKYKTDIEIWLETDEAKQVNKEFQKEALNIVAIEAITAIYKLDESVNIMETLKERILTLMENENDKEV